VAHTRAVIRNHDKGDAIVVRCAFNPKEYGITKKNKWQAPPAKGQNLAEYEFGGGDPATMTLNLMFDTFETGKDVRTEYTNKVWALMNIDASLHDNLSKVGRPPQVLFQWGQAFGFVAVITSITQKFVLFDDEGVPLRATLDVSFQQVKEIDKLPPQNPTSGGVGGSHEWTVKDGDSLASIAYAEYGDSNAWRPIADVNRLTQVRRLRPGLILEIPGRG
jgi:nucleoid-associated protein YgaU